jgi:hypothetical protein
MTEAIEQSKVKIAVAAIEKSSVSITGADVAQAAAQPAVAWVGIHARVSEQ